MNKEIIKIVTKLHGNVLGIGLDEKIVNELEQNKNIELCNLLDSFTSKGKGKSKSGKTIRIKKIRKHFKKKKVDYIICNYESIENYMNSFVKNSIYINKSKLYFYGKIDELLIKKRYSRYKTNIKITNNVVEIDNTNAKNNFLKDLFYQILDLINKIIELIGDVLMN